MKRIVALLMVFALGCAGSMYGQQETTAPPPNTRAQPVPHKHGRSAGGEIGSGSGDVGKGVGKGAGSAAKGAGKGAGDLVTLHPINAAGDVGKGAAGAGKNVAVGTGKGTGKIVKGTGKGIKKIF